MQRSQAGKKQVFAEIGTSLLCASEENCYVKLASKQGRELSMGGCHDEWRRNKNGAEN